MGNFLSFVYMFVGYPREDQGKFLLFIWLPTQRSTVYFYKCQFSLEDKLCEKVMLDELATKLAMKNHHDDFISDTPIVRSANFGYFL